MTEFSFGLFGSQIVAVMHVLVFAQIGCNLSDLGVKLDVVVLLLAEHDGILQVSIAKDSKMN